MAEHRTFLCCGIILYDIIMVVHDIIHLLKTTECTTRRVDSDVNYAFWVTVMCQCRLVNGNECTTLVGDFNSGKACAYVRARGIMGYLYTFCSILL